MRIVAYTQVSKYLSLTDPFQSLIVSCFLTTDTPMEKFDCITAMKALGEENRLRIIRLLMKRQHSVNEIAEGLELTQYNVSKHLRVLREAGLIQHEKQGQQRLYALASHLAEHLARNKYVLDLGCCQFDFTKLPK
jgi:DNA-binding transcriptional ArsR family regulator